MFLIGGLEDQVSLYVWGAISNKPFSITDPIIASTPIYQQLFRFLVNPLLSNQPLSIGIFSIFSSLFGSNFVNYFAILTIIAVLLISYKYFKRFKFAYVYTLLFTLSSYLLTHIGRHIALTQIWVIPLFFMAHENKKSLHIAAVLILTMLISSYLGFFLFLTYGILTSISLVLQRNDRKQVFTSAVTVISISLLLLTPIAFPFAKAVFKPDPTAKIYRPRASKPLSDFATFSSRPWYFFLPPIKNPFLGGITESLLTKIEDTDYFLADDYFANEHQGNYFGLFFLVTLMILVIKYRNNLEKEQVIYLLTAAVLIAFMMPPYFTVSGVTFYTPGWLIFKLAPVFRATSRLGIVVLFLLLSSYSKFLEKLDIGKFFPVILLVVTIFETFVPVKIYKADKPPEVFSYLGEQTEQSKVVIYPYSKAHDGFLWVFEHKQEILNPRGYYSENYESEDLTKNLDTKEGLNKAIDVGMEKLVVFDSAEIEFFNSQEYLVIEKQFENEILFKVITPSLQEQPDQ